MHCHDQPFPKPLSSWQHDNSSRHTAVDRQMSRHDLVHTHNGAANLLPAEQDSDSTHAKPSLLPSPTALSKNGCCIPPAANSVCAHAHSKLSIHLVPLTSMPLHIAIAFATHQITNLRPTQRTVAKIVISIQQLIPLRDALL